MNAWPANPQSNAPRAGIVPHAGWIYSGHTAAAVYRAMSFVPTQTYIVLGAIHVPGVRRAALYPAGSWESPLGTMPIDAEQNRLILDAADGLVEENAAAHMFEHSIEVQIPFLQYVSPQSRLVALMVPPDDNASLLGRKLAEVVASNPAVRVIGSTDLTHYGRDNFGFAPAGSGPRALEWVKTVNDHAMVEAVLSLQADQIVTQSRRNNNACGAGAAAAAVACAKEFGATQGKLLHYTTSFDVMPERNPSDFVGYAAIVF